MGTRDGASHSIFICHTIVAYCTKGHFDESDRTCIVGTSKETEKEKMHVRRIVRHNGAADFTASTIHVMSETRELNQIYGRPF